MSDNDDQPVWQERATVAVLPSVIVGAALLAPVIVLVWNGLSPVGMTEESTGYRYFYSLRVLYTPDERPWLPQGQVMTVWHLVLQWMLTAAGFPVTQLTPRMEIFAYVSAVVTHLTAAVASGWAVRPLRRLSARLAVGAALVWAAFDGGLTYGYHLILPDYHPWIHVVAMVAVGCCLRLTAAEARPSWYWTLALGVFAGLSLALKVTMGAFVLPPVLLLLLLTRRSLRLMVAAGACISLLAAALFLLITNVAYGGSLDATVRFFIYLVGFSNTTDAAHVSGPLVWYAERLLSDPSWPMRVAVATPIMLCASALVARPRLLPLLFVPSSLLSLALLWMRDEPSTLVELFDYALLALVVVSSRVWAPAFSRQAAIVWPAWTDGGPATAAGTAGRALLSVALVVFTGGIVSRSVPELMPGFYDSNATQRLLDEFTSNPSGRTAIVTLDNLHRPLTRDSAIFKGGTNVAESSLWGVSPFVQGLVPDRHYFFPDANLQTPIDLSPFTYLLFVSREPPDRLYVTEQEFAETFGLSLAEFRCPVRQPISGGIQYACRRRLDSPVEEHQDRIGFAPSRPMLVEQHPVAREQGMRRPLGVGEAAYIGDTGEIWRLDADGELTRLRGEPGQVVNIESLGAWSKDRRGVTGLTAVFDGSRWTVSDRPARPVNRNPALRMQPDGSIRAWDVLSRDQTTVTRRTDPSDSRAAEGWLELRQRGPGARIGVRSGFDLNDVAGAPLTAVITARAFGSGAIWARIGNATPGNQVTVINSTGDDARQVASSGDWETLVVRLEPDQTVGERAAVIVELMHSQDDDRLDISQVEIFAGRYSTP